MFCPRCGSVIERTSVGAYCRATGAELSIPLYRGLVQACVTRSAAWVPRLPFAVGGSWSCPGCSCTLVERDGALACPSCRTCLNRLVFELVEFFVHPALKGGAAVGPELALRIHDAARLGQDRAIALRFTGGQLLVVADGAGGIAGGAAAAEFVLQSLQDVQDPNADWSALLVGIDRQLASTARSGETTAVVAYVNTTGVRGASVGDSSAWLIHGDTFTDLTSGQSRKPLVGSGSAVPVSFASEQKFDRVLLGSDGLFKYLPAERICALSVLSPIDAAAAALANAVRLPSGSLQDDVALVVAG